MRFEGESDPFHVYATWETWAFDHSGWNFEADLLSTNAAFEKRRIARVGIESPLAEFCAGHRHRMPDQYWQDPTPRAARYIARYVAPWETWES